jgi:hypothetical protein
LVGVVYIDTVKKLIPEIGYIFTKKICDKYGSHVSHRQEKMSGGTVLNGSFLLNNIA